MRALLLSILIAAHSNAANAPQPTHRIVIVQRHSDGHWYPVDETDWHWSGRLDGFRPSKPMSIDDPSSWPTILNF